MIESSKKLVNKLVKTSAVVAVVGATAFNNLVHAEENLTEETLAATEATGVSEAGSTTTPQTVAEAEAVVAVAQAEVATATETVAAAEAAEAAQEAVVAEAQATETRAAEAVVAAEAAVATAEKVAAEATPEAIAQTEAAIETKTTEVAEAKATEVAASDAATAQEAVVKDVQATVATAQAAVDTAQSAVATLETTPTAAGLAAEKASAETTVANLEASLAAARSELAVLTSQTATEVTDQIAAKIAEISRLEGEINLLATEVRAETTTTSDLGNITGGNTIVVPAYYASQLENIRNYSRLSAAERQNLINLGIRAAQENGFDYTTYNDTSYKSIEADRSRYINVNDSAAMQAIQTELSLYTAELLNQVRRAFGLNEVTVTPSSLEFANAVAAGYAAKSSPFNHNLGENAHDVAVVNSAAAGVGLATTGTWYENVGSNSSSSSTISVDYMKQAIHGQLLYMIFTDASANFAHTYTFLKSDNTGETYLGVQLNGSGFVAGSTTYSGFNQFYEVANGGEVVSANFNRTAIASGKTTTTLVPVDNSAQIAALRNQVAQLTAEVDGLNAYRADVASHPTVAAAQQKVATATSQLQAAQATVADLEARLAQAQTSDAELAAQLADAKAVLASAQADLAVANVNLAKETAKQDDLTAQATSAAVTSARLAEELQALETLLAQYQDANLVANAQAALTAAQAGHTAAQENLAAQLQQLESLKQASSGARAALEAKQLTLTEAQAVLAGLLEEFQGLVVTTDGQGLVAVPEVAPVEDAKPIGQVPTTTAQQPTQPTPVKPAPMAVAKAGASAPAADSVMAKVAQTAQMSALTNQVVKQAAAGPVATASNQPSLPNTGDKSSLVAAAVGAMMMSGVALASHKRREEQ